MFVSGNHREWRVNSGEELHALLEWRDARGGAELWLAAEVAEFPCLAIRISGRVGDVTYFPHGQHPGFRCLADEADDTEGSTRLCFEGADPAEGEEVPNEYVVPFASIVLAAGDFFESGSMSTKLQWFEL